MKDKIVKHIYDDVRDKSNALGDYNSKSIMIKYNKELRNVMLDRFKDSSLSKGIYVEDIEHLESPAFLNVLFANENKVFNLFFKGLLLTHISRLRLFDRKLRDCQYLSPNRVKVFRGGRNITIPGSEEITWSDVETANIGEVVNVKCVAFEHDGILDTFVFELPSKENSNILRIHHIENIRIRYDSGDISIFHMKIEMPKNVAFTGSGNDFPKVMLDISILLKNILLNLIAANVSKVFNEHNNKAKAKELRERVEELKKSDVDITSDDFHDMHEKIDCLTLIDKIGDSGIDKYFDNIINGRKCNYDVIRDLLSIMDDNINYINYSSPMNILLGGDNRHEVSHNLFIEDVISTTFLTRFVPNKGYSCEYENQVHRDINSMLYLLKNNYHIIISVIKRMK